MKTKTKTMWARATLLSALLLAGRWACAGPAGPLRVAFEDFNMQTLTERADKTSTLTEQNVAETESVVMSPHGGYSVTSQRTSDLKYVTAIQRSTVWSEIKKRSVTVSGGGGVLDKSPETLSDAELAQLKRLCHDGLKCMAVEQLYVIKTVKRQIVGGGGDEDGTTAAVRTVITKITKVITNYTTEYHKDTYEYAEVTESSDPSAVYESVTNIIEDNRELCGVNADGGDDDDGTGAAVLLLATLAGGGGPNDPAAAAGRPNDDAAAAAAAGSVSFVNLGTINHYNVNDGAINNVDVTVQQAGGGGGGDGEDRDGKVVIEMEGDGDGAAYPAPFNGQSSLQMPETVYVDAAGAGDGNVTVNNTNNGTYNSNVMQGNADAAGTVNVGSVNEAPLYNDTYNDYSVDSHNRTVNARDFKKFLEFIDNSFSSVLNELGPPAGQNPTV